MIRKKQPIGDTAASVVRHLLWAGPNYGMAIGRALNMPAGSVYVTLRRLVAADLLFRELKTDGYEYGATPYGARELATYDQVCALIEARR